jgi:hypothetical protein
MNVPRRFRRIVGPVVGTLATWLAPAAMAGAEPAPGELWLYSKPRSGIYLQRGEEARRIGFVHGPQVQPRLSPDGARMLYHAEQQGGPGIWLADLDGGQAHRVCDGAQAEWSPDGQRIVFVREGAIMERTLHTGEERCLSPEGWPSCRFPSLLPDGRVLFVSKNALVLADPDGKAAPQVLAEGEILSAPQAAPDGQTIAFQEGAHLHLLALATGARWQLTTAGGVQGWPRWSRDGRSLCYGQSPQGMEGPWDLYWIDLARPGETRLVVREVEPGADWWGISPPASDPVPVPGRDLRVWSVAPGTDLSALGEEGPGFRLLPPEARGRLEGGVAVQCDGAVWGLPAEGDTVVLRAPPGVGTGQQVALTLHDRQGKGAVGLASVEVQRRDRDRVVLQVAYRTPDGGRVEALLVGSRTAPILEIRPTESLGAIHLQMDMEVALLPDRLSNDLIIRPAMCSRPVSVLPFAPLLLVPFEAGMMAVITPSEGQQVRLRTAEGKEAFAGMELEPAGESVFLALLPNDPVWHKAAPLPGADGWTVPWPQAFLAQWRLALAGPGLCDARLWDEEALSGLEAPQLTVKGLDGAPDLSLLYAYGRSWHTPLNVLTLTDLLQDALGLERSARVIDVAGVRGSRTAQPPVPWHVLLTSQEKRLWPEGLPGWPESLDFEPVLMLLGMIRMVPREGVEETVTHLCGDIVRSLAGLEERIQEYRRFVEELEGGQGDQGVRPYPVGANMPQRLQALRESVAGRPLTALDQVVGSVEALRGCFRTGGSLGDKAEYRRFCEASRAALQERQHILATYREFVKRLRDEAGLALLGDPNAREAGEQIRRRAAEVLRNRYYLEGDWRGEKPL